MKKALEFSSPALIFVLSCLYFYFFGNYLFFYQENLSLFIFSNEYIGQFISRPGGLLEYAGMFLTQFFFSNLYGSLIQSAIFASIAVVFFKIDRKINADGAFTWFMGLIPVCLLFLFQVNINYLVHNNLGFLLVGLFFLISISSGERTSRIIIPGLIPLLFYVTGAYALIYIGMATVYYTFRKKIIYIAYLVVPAGISLLVFKRIIFLQPWKELLYYPLPARDYFINPVIVWMLLLFFCLYPAFIILTGLIKIKQDYRQNVSIFSAVITLALTALILTKLYSPDTAALFRLEKMFFARDWNGVIEHQESYQSKNLVAQYYYNTALGETGKLCDRMFFSPQDYGINSLMIPWNSQININRLFRGVYFNYSIGLINEVHRWAFESMVIQGYRPENIKLLIKTNLINGHYRITEKYIRILKKTLHYRDWVKKYEAMLYNPELIMADPELGRKIMLKPLDDFIVRIRNPERNIELLLESNPGNRIAFEYMLASMMLEKNVGGVIDEFSRLHGVQYTRIPRHVEEAALLYRDKTGKLPDLSGMKISDEAESRFSEYRSAVLSADKVKKQGNRGIQKESEKTFWYYIDFKSLQ